MEHKYGGPWTEVKIEAVAYYLECYTRALKQVGFDLWYIDAFAGTGERTVDTEAGGLFEGRAIGSETHTLDGSARRALKIVPRFDHYVFVESDPARCAALSALKSEFPWADIKVLRGDANAEVEKLIRNPPWSTRTNARGVVFLDPYALQSNWETLCSIARTQKIDVWYLFPLRDLVRQLARNFSGIGNKEPMLDRVLGREWRELYKLPEPNEPRQSSLFDQSDKDDLKRSASVAQIEQWFLHRLRAVFAYAPEPLPILAPSKRQIFSLFLAVSNPSNAATRLAKHFASYVMKNYAPASRRKSSP